MFKKTYLFAALIAFPLSFQTCTPAEKPAETESTTAETFSFDWEALGNKLIERMDLQAGESVFLLAKPGQFDALIPVLRKMVAEKGAVDLGAISIDAAAPESWATDFTNDATGKSKEELMAQFSEVDLGVMLPGATPADIAYSAMQELLNQGKGRTIHFHWAGAYGLNGVLLDNDTHIDSFYQEVLFNTDYAALKTAQEEFEKAMRGQTIHVTTPEGTDIRFEIGDRPVTKQDGDASKARADIGQNLIDREVELPAGAIRVAPIETTVNGTIAFPDGQWNGQDVEGVVMTFEAGKLTGSKATKGIEHLTAELESGGEAARSFREFAIGFNPLLAIPETGKPWIPYYGYGAGVIRLSLGDNTELGGNVGGGYVRWNFFTNATVTVGEKVWVKDGEME